MLQSGSRRICMSLLCSVMGRALRIIGKRWRLSSVEISFVVEAGQHRHPSRSTCLFRWGSPIGCGQISIALTLDCARNLRH